MTKYYGKYRGKVVDISDPESGGRIKAIVPEVGFDTISTTWAEPSYIYPGEFKLPPLNSKVWIEFIGGDPDRPIWTGCFYGAPGGLTEAPSRSRGEDDGVESIKGTDSFQTALGTTKNEPSSNFAAQYPFNQMIKFAGGILIEFDNTPGKERIQLYHPLGTFIEMRSDGKCVIKVNSDEWKSVAGDILNHILGSIFVTAEGSWEEKSITRIIEAATIKLGKTAVQGLILGSFGLNKYNFHTHPVTVGSPSGPPLAPAVFVPATDETQKVKGE